MSPEERRAVQRDEDLRTILSTPAGRRLMWRMIEEVGAAFAPTFSLDAAAAAYGEGRRSVGLHLMAEVQRVSVDHYLLMLNETVKARQEEQLADSVHQGDDPDGA